MKLAIALLLIPIAAAAQSPLVVPQGTKATLQVTYQFKSIGKHVTSSKDRRSDWNVLREVSITGQYVANAPQPFGALHQDDKKQKQDMKALQGSVESVQQKMQPTMQDMMRIAEKCGETDEACITREIEAYGRQMDTATVNSARADADAIARMATHARFQMWQLTSQTGTYSIDERVNKQVFEMTCTETRVCKRSEVRTGAGNLAPPAGGKSAAGASMLEVDSEKRDMVVMLPLPLAPLSYTQTVTTTIPDDVDAGTTKGISPPWMLKANQPAPVAIPGGLKTVSGTQTYKIDGDEAAGGTLTVNWIFTRQ